MPWIEFEVTDAILNTVQQIEARFHDHGIETSANAVRLFALTLNAQYEENESIAEPDLKQIRLNRINEILHAFFADSSFFAYYQSNFGNHRLTYNRALHVVNHLGELTKFPWTATED
jgi:hypothetical protein